MTTVGESGGARVPGENADNPKEPSILPVVASGAIVLGMAVGGALIGRRFGHPLIGAAGALVVSLPVANWVGGALTDALSDEVNPTIAPPRPRGGEGPGRRRAPPRGNRSKQPMQLETSEDTIASNLVLFGGKGN